MLRSLRTAAAETRAPWSPRHGQSSPAGRGARTAATEARARGPEPAQPEVKKGRDNSLQSEKENSVQHPTSSTSSSAEKDRQTALWRPGIPVRRGDRGPEDASSCPGRGHQGPGGATVSSQRPHREGRQNGSVLSLQDWAGPSCGLTAWISQQVAALFSVIQAVMLTQNHRALNIQQYKYIVGRCDTGFHVSQYAYSTAI